MAMPKSENRDALDTLFHCLCVDFGQSSGEAIIRQIVYHLGGLRVTIPDEKEILREERDRRIRSLFNGCNYNDLAERFGLQARHIRRIIHEEGNK